MPHLPSIRRVIKKCCPYQLSQEHKQGSRETQVSPGRAEYAGPGDAFSYLLIHHMYPWFIYCSEHFLHCGHVCWPISRTEPGTWGAKILTLHMVKEEPS